MGMKLSEKTGHTQISNKAPINVCPFCGSKAGYYTKQQARGTIEYIYNYDGSEAENDGMYDLLTVKGGIYAYCLHCSKRLFKMQESEAQPWLTWT